MQWRKPLLNHRKRQADHKAVSMDATPSAEKLLCAHSSWEQREGTFPTSWSILIIVYIKTEELPEQQSSESTPSRGNFIYLSLQSHCLILLPVWVDLGSETLPPSHPSYSGPMRTSACAKRPSWARLLEPLVSSLPLSKDVEETWHRPEVSVTKLYYHNPIKCVWGLMSSSSVWEQGRLGLAVGGFVPKELRGCYEIVAYLHFID